MEALRSGSYAQTTRQLRSETSTSIFLVFKKKEFQYCCLGVLCDIHAAENQTKDLWAGNSYDRQGGTPAPIVLAWSGLTRAGAWNLVGKNDDEGLSFTGIADYIEQNWATL